MRHSAAAPSFSPHASDFNTFLACCQGKPLGGFFVQICGWCRRIKTV